MYKEFLKNLGFHTFKKNEKTWSWKREYYILVKEPSETMVNGKTKISKNAEINFTDDKRESILFQGQFIFNDLEFAEKLFKSIGIYEKINRVIVPNEPEKNSHNWFFKENNFIETVQNKWIKNIFLVAIVPPKFDTDRGKCIIMKKPNIKNLKERDRLAHVVYKGRYFFDDKEFTNKLFEKIGFFRFNQSDRNNDYFFQGEYLDNYKAVEDEFLKF
jgi:hypothetical protein